MTCGDGKNNSCCVSVRPVVFGNCSWPNDESDESDDSMSQMMPGAWCPTIGWPRPACPVHATGGAHISVGARELTGTDHHRETRQQVLVTISKREKALRSMWHLWSQKALEIKFLIKMRRKPERNICSLLIWRQREETVWYFTKVSPILLIESVNFWHKINLCCKILRIGLKVVI